MKGFSSPGYLNWDNDDDRSIIKKKGWRAAADLVVFDELHKMKGWKNYLKGLFDTRPEHLRILVTGSARLDPIRKGGIRSQGDFSSIICSHSFPLNSRMNRSAPISVVSWREVVFPSRSLPRTKPTPTAGGFSISMALSAPTFLISARCMTCARSS
jgi:hypothetical protein